MWNSNLDIDILVKSESFMHAMVKEATSLNPWMTTLVYGPPILLFRTRFLDTLRDIGLTFNDDWLLMGDFNMVLSSADQLGGNLVASSSRNVF